ncbi:CPBP family intramembrane glutamic endopeptidase [Clostridium polyendosporum]|nr:type II CAAX endopeptidase family protein [Clostridium polyendosporum]
MAIENGFVVFFSALCFYIFIFIIPVMLYLKILDKVNPFTYLKLNHNILSGIFKGIFIGVLIFIFVLLKNKFQIYRYAYVKQDIFYILGRVIVGPLEEIPFRGFYMQKFSKYMSFWKSNILSSMLFSIMHVLGQVNFESLILIFIIGLWMGYIFKETQSLWCVSIIHSIYDLSIWIIL